MDGIEARRILDEYFPRKKRTIVSNYSTPKFNIICWGSENITEYKHCPLDPGVRLIKIKGELRCPQCGYTFRKEEAPNEEGVTIKHNKQQTAIISGKGNKKKHYSDNGEEIKDPDLFNEHVTYYNEELPK